MQVKRILRKAAAAAALGSLAAAALLWLAPEAAPQALSVSTAPALTTVGLASAWLYLFLTPGYRRVPFWCSALAGSALLLPAAGAGVLEPLALRVPLLRLHPAVLILAGFILFAIARVVMRRPRLSTRRFAYVFALLLPAIVFAAWQLVPAPAEQPGAPGEHPSIDDWLALLDPAYHEYRDEVKDYLDDAAEEQDLTRERQEELVQELNERIRRLEAEVERFEEMSAATEADAEAVERLRRKLEELEANRFSEDDFTRVTSYAEAVRPQVPLVRDFAVEIASQYPGPYYRSPGARTPGRHGIEQVLALQQYIVSQWSYVNDPFVIHDNYYSPAERTIALGLGGDCVDYSILVASAVEAIGGRARIMHGYCAEGGHAWPEVQIGNEAAWREAMSILRRWYPGRRVDYLQPRNRNDYWLSLDWQAGVFTCGGSPSVAYESR